jgi:hypothetical protein
MLLRSFRRFDIKKNHESKLSCSFKFADIINDTSVIAAILGLPVWQTSETWR